ncbi:MAG: DUF418 domain-containing protein [Flavobacteriales bacterium]|nr:DUF418 domain-containing protein [Flavobacteriales bacterium]
MKSSIPTQKADRIQQLDIFRGFAIFGIFMVNILVMNISFVYRGEWLTTQVGWVQDVPRIILEEFFFGKFFTIFSFLFGLGVALQIGKAKESGRFSNAFFIRRFGSLFVFGLAHILFIWSGDILHIYGALGFLLLLLFRLKANAMGVIALVIFLFPFYFETFKLLVNDIIGYDHMAPLAAYSRQELVDLKHNGSFFSGIPIRLKEYSFLMQYVYSAMIPAALAMMLIGGFFYKKGLLDNIALWVRRGRVMVPVCFILFLAYRIIILYYIKPNYDVEPGSNLAKFLMTIYYFADLVISLSYLWFLAFLLRFDFWKTVLTPIAFVGRMALTNYIMQSVLGYLIMRTFNGYDSFSIAQSVLIVMVIYAVQIPLSKLWLSRFKFGPLEWLWRCISYGKVLSIR